jgi:hypothetical protein
MLFQLNKSYSNEADGMMIMNDKQVMIWKAAAMACLMYYPDIHLK